MYSVYKDPQNGKTEDLINTAKEYLCQLVKLRMEVTINKTGSVELFREVYLEGNPPFHLRNVPWDKFIKYLSWAPTQISEYEDIISDTRRIWQECLVEFEKHKEPDVIL